MSVELDPSSQLTFTRPFNQMVKEVLIIQNSNSFPVAFKVKTTTPRQYCVRPNAGRIEPGETVDVQVVLQPMREDPPPDFRCRDKFLVQSVAIPAEHNQLPVAELWPVIEQEKADVYERKLRCSFLMPAGNQDEAGQVAATASATASANGEDASLLAGDSTFTNASDNVSVISLQRDLREAKSTIRQLQERNERQQRELNEAQSVARQRRAGDANRTAVKKHNDNMVTLSIQVVVGIAVFSFFFGFWFF